MLRLPLVPGLSMARRYIGTRNKPLIYAGNPAYGLHPGRAGTNHDNKPRRAGLSILPEGAAPAPRPASVFLRVGIHGLEALVVLEDLVLLEGRPVVGVVLEGGKGLKLLLAPALLEHFLDEGVQILVLVV